MDGFVAASGTQWSRLYFVTYYVVSVIIVLNLFTSFVLEAVTKVQNKPLSCPARCPVPCPVIGTEIILILSRNFVMLLPLFGQIIFPPT